ncbi:hypothetical protein QVD17_31558 [Tagetes erecta]|uniref:Uncharacterized protein n=1 Tax=Tagetes erecta TaxID=13708 RepID=A0AAD8NNY8_TARER|nr:hypothetical protein QVD17_31558 [Tagetes erecta]
MISYVNWFKHYTSVYKTIAKSKVSIRRLTFKHTMVLEIEQYNGGYRQQTHSKYQGPTGGYNSYHGVTEYTSPYSGSFQVPTYPPSHGPYHQSGWSSGGDYYGSGANHYPGGNMLAPVKPAVGAYESSYYEGSYTNENSHHPVHGYGSPHNPGHGSPTGLGKTSGFGVAITNETNKLTHGHNNHENSYDAHDNSHNASHGNPTNFGKASGFGGAITNQINKLKNGYENSYTHDNSHHSGHDSPYNQGHGSPHHHGHGSRHHHGHGGYEKTHSFGSAIKNKFNNLTHQGHNNYGHGNPNYGQGRPNFGHGSQNYGHGGHNGVNHGQQPSWIVKGLDDDDE